MTQFTRKVDGYDGDWVRADDINELQEAIETLEGGVTGGLPALDARLDIIESGVYNVLTYGAVGDGVTDDTAAIQAAIDAAVTSELATGEIYFPPGTYNISSLLTVSYRHGTVIRGAGPGVTTIEQQTDNTGIFRFVTDPFAHHITLRDMTLAYANQQENTDTGAIAIDLWGDANANPNFLTFDNLAITKPHFGIKTSNTVDATVSFFVTVRNVSFSAIAGTAIEAISPSGKPAWLLDQLWFSPGTGDAKPTGYGIRLSGIDLVARNLVIADWLDEFLYLAGFSGAALLDNWHWEGGTETPVSSTVFKAYVANGGVIARNWQYQATINGAAGVRLFRIDSNALAVFDGIHSSATISSGNLYPVYVGVGVPSIYARGISGTWTDVPIDPAHSGSLAALRQVDDYHYLPTKDGTPTDADVPIAKDGVSVLDTTNDLLYVRSGGAWVSTALT